LEIDERAHFDDSDEEGDGTISPKLVEKKELLKKYMVVINKAVRE
jgi:hypothetical protein